jgi:hypothetical protein
LRNSHPVEAHRGQSNVLSSELNGCANQVWDESEVTVLGQVEGGVKSFLEFVLIGVRTPLDIADDLLEGGRDIERGKLVIRRWVLQIRYSYNDTWLSTGRVTNGIIKISITTYWTATSGTAE